MHHLFVTPLVAGVVTAGIIALSPSFSDPYEAAYASEEPLVEAIDTEFTTKVTAPVELKAPELRSETSAEFSFSNPRRVVLAKIETPDVLTDIAYTRSDMAFAIAAAGQVKDLAVVPLRAEAPLWEVSVSRMNLRAGPGTTFKKLGQLLGGTVLEQTGNAKGPWLEIAVLDTGKTGWLHSKYLKSLD